jgi:hypothetical protein
VQEFFIQRAQQGLFERVMVSASIINQLIIAPVSFRFTVVLQVGSSLNTQLILCGWQGELNSCLSTVQRAVQYIAVQYSRMHGIDLEESAGKNLDIPHNEWAYSVLVE